MGQPTTDHESTLRCDAERLADILSVLQRCFLLRLSQDLARGNVSFPQYLLLGFLVQQEQLTMTEIASRMGHTTAAATGLVDRLEKLELVVRVHAQEDRRKVFVRPTPEGCALVASVRSDMVENLMRMMSHLERDEQKAWVRIYEKIFDFCQSP
jgi:DNA-binding MarR family transcriptional regulator